MPAKASPAESAHEPKILTGEPLELAILEHMALKSQIKGLEARADLLARDLLPSIMLTPGVDHYDMPGKGVMRIQDRTEKSIKAEILIALGVEADKIAAATVTTTSKPFLRFYAKDGKE